MSRRILAVPLSVAAVAMWLAAAPAAAGSECGIILPVADRLEAALNTVAPAGTPSYVAGQVRKAVSPLYGLRTPSAIDLRIRSDMLAAQIDDSDPYRPASPDLLVRDLAATRELLAGARGSCAPQGMPFS
ncbi:hypothetical protein BST36_02560 [Mycolicibacterium moriokaense]|jgi:hypothetical protein|uniref:Hemophore-related protein n=1 Tax=Mycolicibacterium moriokaense TaxID=39691 RepID=A0AAD1HEC3_9MYCO|nr:hypothetical protein [Mycolicibacterium moriokaense]MCV7039354.1 hypothetical protein [Mycolicibacterium moriokaense]ORB26815.1 hypothetical protein BST36_02560 [Mycolicibacterium moriokaense]BBX03877.1 hypothetical protein MMOR_48130 [Mycolicibacterium moriokaense]